GTAHRKKTKKRTNSSKGKYWPTPHLTRRITLFTEAGLLIVGVAYSVFAYQQWVVMRKQLKLTKYQIDQTERDRRAWVVPLTATLKKKLAVGEAPIVQITCRNSGQTLAYDVKVRTAISVNEGEAQIEMLKQAPRRDPDSPDKTSLIVPPNGTIDS